MAKIGGKVWCLKESLTECELVLKYSTNGGGVDLSLDGSEIQLEHCVKKKQEFPKCIVTKEPLDENEASIDISGTLEVDGEIIETLDVEKCEEIRKGYLLAKLLGYSGTEGLSLLKTAARLICEETYAYDDLKITVDFKIHELRKVGGPRPTKNPDSVCKLTCPTSSRIVLYGVPKEDQIKGNNYDTLSSYLVGNVPHEDFCAGLGKLSCLDSTKKDLKKLEKCLNSMNSLGFIADIATCLLFPSCDPVELALEKVGDCLCK